MKIFVSDFSESTNIADLAGWFEKFGTVTALRIAQGKKRRYAIVEMPSDAQAKAAMDELGKWSEYRWLEVKEAETVRWKGWDRNPWD